MSGLTRNPCVKRTCSKAGRGGWLVSRNRKGGSLTLRGRRGATWLAEALLLRSDGAKGNTGRERNKTSASSISNTHFERIKSHRGDATSTRRGNPGERRPLLDSNLSKYRALGLIYHYSNHKQDPNEEKTEEKGKSSLPASSNKKG